MTYAFAQALPAGVVVPPPARPIARVYEGVDKSIDPAWVAPTLIDECAPSPGYLALYPLRIRFFGSNADATQELNVKVSLRFEDETEADVHTLTLSPGVSNSRDLLTSDIARFLKDGLTVIAVRFYGWYSVAAGVASTGRLEAVNGFQI